MTILAQAIALINEAACTQKLSTKFPVNKVVLKLLKILIKNNFIASYTLDTSEPRAAVTVFFFNTAHDYGLRKIKIISTSGSHVSIKYKNLLKFFRVTSSSTVILSTSKGFMTIQEALLNRTGGKLICYVS